MLNLFKTLISRSTAGREIVAAASGRLVSLEEVSDPAFAKKMLGDGVAIELIDDTIVAPAFGRLAMLFSSMHAFGLVLPNGVEILVHIGINTVSLGGVGFQCLAKKNDVVRAGDPVITVDRKLLIQKGYDPVTMVIVTDQKNCNFNFVRTGNVTRGESVIASF
jgi:glucose-specific phosphotransferase system IIA component